MLVKTAGVKHLVIVVNKMDDSTVEWDQSRFVCLDYKKMKRMTNSFSALSINL